MNSFLGNFYKHLAIFFWSHWLLSFFLSSKVTLTATTYLQSKNYKDHCPNVNDYTTFKLKPTFPFLIYKMGQTRPLFVYFCP